MEIHRALLSVHDKVGLTELARALDKLRVTLIASGGTAKAITAAGLPVTSISDVTGAPEMLDGRVKTLHPRIHAGLLALRDDLDHVNELRTHAIKPIDLVCVNFYPFERTVEGGAWLGEVLEMIDIGGPTMVRAAAKNYLSVAVLTDPADYPAFIEELEAGQGSISPATLERLAAKAFRAVAHYDTAIANYLTGRLEEVFPETWTLSGRKSADLRYGENPHQAAALYASGSGGLAAAQQIQGKELSYNNLLDLDAAWSCVAEFEEPAAVVVKHTNPCGVARHSTLDAAYERAREADSLSAFGGVVALNRELDAATARKITETFIEAVVAPSLAEEALEVLDSKKNLRVLVLDKPLAPRPQVKPISGGFLVQQPDTLAEGEETRVVTSRQPSEAEWEALRFAWKVAKHVKSNAIVFATGEATAGIGAGQMSRVDAARLAQTKAMESLKGTVAASDAFFPFRDGVDVVAKAGATAIIQPGGSVRDEEVIAAADELGLAMVFTGIRHFRHG